MSFKSTGIIKYDPHNTRGTFNPWWIIIQCDHELIKYYQHIFYKLYWKKLQTAMWGPHISIVRGEIPKNKNAWKAFNGKPVEFEYEYDGEFHTNGQYFWIKAWSPEFGLIRESLGLTKDPKVPYHISIGSLGQ